MKRISAICVASCLLVPLEAGAQTPKPGRLNYSVCMSSKELKPGSGPLLRPDLPCAGESSTPAVSLAAPAFQAPAAQKSSEDARRRRRNGLIGLGVGVGAALLYGSTVCRGSDSAGLVLATCHVPIGAMIGAGFFIGRATH